MGLKTRLVTEVGKRWEAGVSAPRSCSAKKGNCSVLYEVTEEQHDECFKVAETHVCPDCGTPFDGGHWFWRPATVWDTPSGKLEPGCLFWRTAYRYNEDENAPRECYYHDNCDGTHLTVVLPNGEYWDIDSRANNCTMKEDRIHRCWIRHGEPPNVTVDKNGPTCQAGAGSIMAGSYHGFLRNGEFTP
jgi:hypothetical protein